MKRHDHIVEEVREQRLAILVEANGDVVELVRQLQARALAKGVVHAVLTKRDPSKSSDVA
jgi:hypothetical protein